MGKETHTIVRMKKTLSVFHFIYLLLIVCLKRHVFVFTFGKIDLFLFTQKILSIYSLITLICTLKLKHRVVYCSRACIATQICVELEQRVPAGRKTFGVGEEHLDNNVPEVQILAASAGAHMPSEDMAAHKPRSRTAHRPRNWQKKIKKCHEKSNTDGAGHSRAAGFWKFGPSPAISCSAFPVVRWRRSTSLQTHPPQAESRRGKADRLKDSLDGGSDAGLREPLFPLSLLSAPTCRCSAAAHPGERTEGKRLLNQT